MFAHLWPGVTLDEVPIGSVTNGIHARSWVAPAMADLFETHVGPDWMEAGADEWRQVDGIDDETLWKVRGDGRAQLVEFARRRVHDAAVGRGTSEADLSWIEELLDPDVLTIGYARRFAAYKRATLLLQQPDRLHALLSSEERPVQLVFAGKAHPSDQQGKEMIREVVQFGKQRDVRHRIVFLEDYDIAVAQRLLAGCDVWLNTPRRPFEACGTSGMKAVLNGALHCSIRDGWWDEMFDGDNGFAIASAETYGDIDWRDRVEASGLFDLLERRIVPLFYERDDGIPHEWLARVRTSLRTLAPKVSAARMLRSYVTDLYEPAARHADSLAADGRRRARDLAAWKAKVRHAWPNVHVDAVSGDDPTAELGAARQVTAVVELDGLSPDDVQVQLAHGAVAPDDELRGPSIVPMVLSDKEGADRYCYTGTFECERAGRYGFAVRVMPWHADIASPAELGLVTWAP
jgi:starch phosphorylase